MNRNQVTVDPPFGTHALPAGLEKLRQIGERIPVYGVRSAIRKIIKSRQSGPYDVTLPNGINARMNPWGNVCEKRIFCGAPYFDRPEMSFLRDRISAKQHDSFVFVDVGANVGFYSLYVTAMAAENATGARVLMIEPDPENGRRLGENLAINGLEPDRALHVPFAVSDHEGAVSFVSDGLENRGQARIGEGTGAVTVQAKPLVDILASAGITRIDALKIDVEGHEIPALTHFFANAPTALWPTTLIAEMVHNNDDLPRLLERNDYVLTQRADINAIFTRQPATDT